MTSSGCRTDPVLHVTVDNMPRALSFIVQLLAVDDLSDALMTALVNAPARWEGDPKLRTDIIEVSTLTPNEVWITVEAQGPIVLRHGPQVSKGEDTLSTRFVVQ